MGFVYLYDSEYGNAAAAKTGLSGVMLYYELATPEVYTLDNELSLNYRVDDFGTEEAMPAYTDEVNAPLAYDVQYAMNAVDKIRRMPENYVHRENVKQVVGTSETNVLSQKAINDNYAKKVGVEEGLVAGAAKAIAGNQRQEKEFTSMVIDGADGVAKINEVKGKSLVWNQQITDNDINKTVNDVSVTRTLNGKITIVGTATSSGGRTSYLSDGITQVILDHKYLFKNTINTKAFVTSGRNSGEFIAVSERGTNIFTSTKNFSDGRLGLNFDAGVEYNDEGYVYLIDLTLMFGAGNEPATVEEFEAMFPNDYYEYNAGEIISNKTEKLDIYDSEESLKSTLPIDLATITGKATDSDESVVIFPDGMRSTGGAYDSLVVDDDGYARKAIVRMTDRAYQSGDEDDATVITDKTNTVYALATPIEYTLDTPIQMTFQAYNGGTIVQDPQAPDSAPMRMNITFALDAVGTLNNLPNNYISAASIDAFLAQLGTAMGGTWTRTYNSETGKHEFSYTPNTEHEKVLTIETILGNTAEVDRYYRLGTLSGALTINLPTISDSSNSIQGFVVNFTTGNSPSVTINGGTKQVSYYSGYDIKPNTTYELNITYNGEKWIVAYAVIE